MSKYKINIDKPLPDPKVIKKYQNFDTLYDQYQVNTRFEFWRSLYRKPAYFAGMVAVFAILFLIFEAVDGNGTKGQSPFINPPFPEVDPEFSSILLDADSSLLYAIESGSRLHLPAQAWVDEKQKPVSGKVELKIRELKDPADMFLADISSKYDSAENEMILASSGMMEIQAFSDGKPVFLDKGKNIEIDYFSYDTAGQLGVYRLDTTDQNWAFEGNEEMELIAMESTIPTRPEMPEILRIDDNQWITKSIPIMEKPGRPFGVKVKNLEDHPEFRGYEKIYWAYKPAENSANPWEEGLIGENSPWNDVRVTPLQTRGYYELKFAKITSSGGMQVKKVIANAMFEARSEKEAEAIYQRNYQKWQEVNTAREKQNAEKQERARKRREAKQAYDEALIKWQAAVSNADSIEYMPRTCYRKFKIDQVGVFNLANSIPFPPATATVKLIDEAGEKIENEGKPLYIVDEKVNAIFPAKVNDEGNYMLKFDVDAQKVVWSTDMENNILMLSSEKLYELKNDTENVQELMPERIPSNFSGELKTKLLEQNQPLGQIKIKNSVESEIANSLIN